jgi:hypothetical protein
MVFSDLKSMYFCIKNGIYSTYIKNEPTGYWRPEHEGTFADYLSMKEGDDIYFFAQRKIYGIGTLKNIGHDCKFNNYHGSDLPITYRYKDIKGKMIFEGKDKTKNRWICTFEHNPSFFRQGVDMDDVLSSNPNSFRMLRAFSGLSFIKIDDIENKALKDIILKRNEAYLGYEDKGNSFVFEDSYHIRLVKLLDSPGYEMGAGGMLDVCSEGSRIKHEKAIEASLLWQLINYEKFATNTFGKWDYISHQVIASPFKPVAYVDKMDIFGYRYIPTYDTVSKYLVIEIKKDNATRDSIDQLMKYVDWIHNEYAHGDYSMIEAYVVAYGFDDDVAAYKQEACIRNYTIGSRPTLNKKWTDVKLIEYRYDTELKRLRFNIVD